MNQQIGISGKLFLGIKFLFLALAFALGQYFLASNANAVNQSFHFVIGTSTLVEFMNKGLIVGVYVFLMSYMLFVHVLDTPLWRSKRTPKEKVTFVEQLRAPHNNSHAILFVGILLSGLAIVLMLHGANFRDFLFAILTRGVIGELVGDLLTVLFARVIGQVKSMDEFKMWVDEKYNDSHAEMIRGIKLTCLILALSL